MARAPAAVTLLAAGLASLAGSPACVAASAFRGHQAPAALHGDLLGELERVLGSGRRVAAEGRVTQFEDAMRPIFQSLPHNSEDRLPASGVRYLLHRVFVERHGWFVEGLASGGESWNASSPASFFAEHAGNEMEDVFERRLGGKGLSLHETAVFAATLESLVHGETLERLHASYRALGLETKEDSAKEHEVERVIDTYMLMLVLGLNHTDASPELVSRAWRKIEAIYPTWGATKKWVREIRKEVVSASPESRTAFATTTRVLEEMADRYGRWQDSECIAMKEDLLRYERAGSGRVPLKDFYAAALDGKSQYTESKEYLRQLGALDEAQPSQPSVIIANYINGPSNCLASSKFYSVCCINECEALMGPLERHLAAPEASPSRLVELVERLPSATVDAPRTLPPSLVRRLEEIATHHGGRVPLHGRLFAQWMHHAFPRECPYPHVSGTTKPMTSKEYQQVHGERHVLDVEALQLEVEHYGQSEESDVTVPAELPWSSHEELFVHLPAEVAGGGVRSLLRSMVMALAASSMCAVAVRTMLGGLRASVGRKPEKYML